MMLSKDDLAERDAVIAKLEDTALALLDLSDRAARKGDVTRAGILKVGAAWKVQRAAEIVAEAYR